MASPNFKNNPEYINKNGRPKKGHSLTEILTELGKIKNDDGISRKKALGEKLWSMALEGDFPALKYVFDRIDGTPRQTIDMDVVSEGQLVIIRDGNQTTSPAG